MSIRAVYKYPLEIQDEQVVLLPTGAKILTVQAHFGATQIGMGIGHLSLQIVVAGKYHNHTNMTSFILPTPCRTCWMRCRKIYRKMVVRGVPHYT